MSAHLDADPVSPLHVSAREVCFAAGVSYRKLDYWIRCHLVTPAREASGSGSQRRFDVGQIGSVRIVAALVRMGVDHDTIRAVVERVERDGADGTFDPYPGVTVDLGAVAETPALPTREDGRQRIRRFLV